ncbi:MAG: ABC transporter substrate-binding protein, partial [Alphaproteobacteria bacterium]
ARVMHLDRVVFRVVPDASAAEAGLATGAIDVLPEVETHRMDALRARGAQVMAMPGLSWAVLLIQTRDPVLSDVRVRRAIAHAIDLGELADARGEGLVKPHPSPVDAGSTYFDERFRAWPAHDPAKARALLKEAGYKGQKLAIQTNKRSSANYDNAVMIQAMLAAAGFNVELEVLDWATQLNNYLQGNFQLQSFGYSARFDPGLRFASLIADKDKSKWAQWDDPRAIALLQESSRTLDEGRRREIFATLHAMLAEQVPTIGLYYDPGVEAVGPKVRGYRTWPASRPLPWGVWKAG